ncbi:unnamed protein product [Ilex paraguariensis]|uniref:Expansin-like EG45 domain-containing protein n=1 Tax=Ilex paraguariensis TaxID=185542 RepID=A0ABC8USW5_9AQUA
MASGSTIVQNSLCFAFLSYGSPSRSNATKCNGNRADQFPPGNLFVAVSEGLWDNGAACGRRYRLRCLSGYNKPCKDGTVDVRVVDFCPRRPCPATIVMSNDAFGAISHSPDAKINVEFIQYKTHLFLPPSFIFFLTCFYFF